MNSYLGISGAHLRGQKGDFYQSPMFVFVILGRKFTLDMKLHKKAFKKGSANTVK